MKKIFTIIVLLLCPLLFSQSVIGKWKTIDDETGKALGVVEIYEKGGKVYGRVLEILNPKDRSKTCTNCSGDDKDKPILGLTIMKGLKKDGDEYNGGKILDPKSGKLYKCYINLENKDKLKVRGYIGISLFGRTQYWHRVK
ncbi:DUF2147 domain-containing protein [Flavobacterium pallidum]|uniref:DUF2147 domain-containing protein n=1 Tax=Flavobacterium pallidum TaxID=2172098 RepID=A0A2S1SKS4_9FLAO|nr:DUF2147 domain-containing protein [Flavobacterium pallidum]AWI26981.1 DUF2147 domain-containing protein [Flavobacterium pallidum]